MQHRIIKSLPKFKFSASNASSRLKPLDSFKFRLDIPLITVANATTRIHIKSTPDSLVELCTKIINSTFLYKPSKWQISEVVEWINDLGFSQYQNTFRKNFINGRYLMQLDANSLIKINIKTFDHIQIITNSIKSIYGLYKSFLSKSFSHLDNSFCQFDRIHFGSRSKCQAMMHLMETRKSKQNHWQALETWLQHQVPINNILIGKPREINSDCKFIKLHLVEPMKLM